MWDELKNNVKLELKQIHHLLDEYRELLSTAKESKPGKAEILALAGILNSFYNGVENIFKRVSTIIDGTTSRNSTWHRDLLDSMTKKTPIRKKVISENLYNLLSDYLRFRHRFRHSYSFQISWEHMLPLILKCEETLEIFETELTDFLKHPS